MLFASTGGNGGNDDDGYDDDLVYEDPPQPARRAPGAQRGGGSGSGDGGSRGGSGGGRPRTVQYQPEERYWTEYLRIALPILGLLLLIGLLWFWALQLTKDDDGNGGDQPVVTETATTESIIPDSTPTLEPTEEEVILPPTLEPTVDASTPDTGETTEETPAAPTAIEIGAAVIVLEDGVNMRADATTGSDTVTQLNAGDVLEITDGPFEADTYVWWEVLVEESGAVGYVVEDFIEVVP